MSFSLTSQFFSKFSKNGRKPTQTATKHKIYDGKNKDTEQNFTKVKKGSQKTKKLLINSLKSIYCLKPLTPLPAGNQGKSAGELKGNSQCEHWGDRELGNSKSEYSDFP